MTCVDALKTLPHTRSSLYIEIKTGLDGAKDADNTGAMEAPQPLKVYKVMGSYQSRLALPPKVLGFPDQGPHCGLSLPLQTLRCLKAPYIIRLDG